MRRRIVCFCAGVAVVLAVGAASGGAAAPGPVPVAFIDGKGFGHGVGMAQDGAYWMGRGGSSTAQILGQFYPGTKTGKAAGVVRVTVVAPTAANSVVVGFPGGGEVRDALSGSQSSGFPIRVPAGGRVRVTWGGGRYHVDRGGGSLGDIALAASVRPQVDTSTSEPPTILTSTTTTTSTMPPTSTTTAAPSPSTTTTAPASGASSGPASARPLWAVPTGNGVVAVPDRARQYRGVLQATAEGGTALRLVDHVDVEQYLRGMGEVRDPSWPPAALRAQATAARTYAMRAIAGGGDLCDDTRCQVYLGQQAEYAAMDKAVADTKGQALTFDGRLASAVYSANGGGVEASRQEGFGETGAASAYAYLRPGPYPTSDPGPWSVRVALADIAARFAYRGAVTGLRVTATGPSGRALEVTLDGALGPKPVSGLTFARTLALRSTLFGLRIGTSDAPPPPPDATGDLLQAPPEDVSGLATALPSGGVSAAGPAIPDFQGGVVDASRVPLDAPRGASPAALALALLAAFLTAGITLAIVTARRAGLSTRVLRPF